MGLQIRNKEYISVQFGSALPGRWVHAVETDSVTKICFKCVCWTITD